MIAKVVMRKILTSLISFFVLSHAAFALNVVFDNRTPDNLKEWIDKSYVREQMEVTAPKICKLLYGGTKNENMSENFKLTLYATPKKGGAPGFATGSRVTWKVGANPKGSATGGIGLLGHEMTHTLDLNARPMSVQRFRKVHDSTFIEATAVWVTDYNVQYGYRKYSSPSIILDRRYEALRHHRSWGGYRAGAGFFDFLEHEYGKGTTIKLIRDQTKNGKKPWERILGKTIDELVAQWRNMETIYDPVFQWNYNGTAAGAVRHDKKYCALNSIVAERAADNSGAWLNGVTSAKVAGCDGGNITLALHGKFPKAGKVAIASLGSVKEGNGKALLIATTSKANMLAAYLIASVPGRGCRIVSSTAIPIEPTAKPISHSLILTVKKGEVAAVILDGKPVAKIDMKTKCEGCTFSPVFALGGITKGFGVAGFAEPRGEGGVFLDDVRVFTRTFRSKETASYAATFGPDYRGGVAVEAAWCGPQGGSDINNPKNWKCFNSYGEQIVAVPTKETEVKVWFTAIPSIPPKSKFSCKSFTIDGIAVVDSANVDLRGVRIVDFSDNTRIITRDGYGIAVNAARGKRLRLDGKFVVASGMKFDGNIEMKSSSHLRLPEDPKMAYAKSLSVKGEGAVVLRPGKLLPSGGFQNVMRLKNMPDDMTRFKLDLSHAPNKAEFKTATGGKFIGVSSR